MLIEGFKKRSITAKSSTIKRYRKIPILIMLFTIFMIKDKLWLIHTTTTTVTVTILVPAEIAKAFTRLRPFVWSFGGGFCLVRWPFSLCLMQVWCLYLVSFMVCAGCVCLEVFVVWVRGVFYFSLLWFCCGRIYGFGVGVLVGHPMFYFLWFCCTVPNNLAQLA